MSKTQAQLLEALREDRLDVPTANDVWPDETLRRYINDGAKDITRRAECLQKKSTIPAVVGTQEYTLPTNMIRVYRVEFTPTGSGQPVYPLEYRDFNSMDAVWWTQQAITQATPQLFTMWGFPPSLKLVVYPKPSTTGTFTVFYYAMATELATDGTQASSVVEVPDGWEDAVVDYAEYLARRSDNDPRWQEAKALYEEHVEDLVRLTMRWTDQAGEFTPGVPLYPNWLIHDGW